MENGNNSGFNRLQCFVGSNFPGRSSGDQVQQGHLEQVGQEQIPPQVLDFSKDGASTVSLCQSSVTLPGKQGIFWWCSGISRVPVCPWWLLPHSGAATEEILTLSSPPLRCWHCPGFSCAEISLLQAEHSQLLVSPRDAPLPCPSPWARSRVFLSCPGNAQHWTQQWGWVEGTGRGFSQKLPEAPCWTHRWPELDPSGMVGAPLG